ncbi:hypothetical protein HZB04_02550 [Candidatus Wolfebacteria bacterium]|nr:hypothetical protein [Candidatus Wolfebacteria bacterium]
MSNCEKIKQEYENLKSIKKEFDLEYQKAAETGNLEKANELKAELEQKRDALQKKLWPFEELPSKELKEQYESKKKILENTGLLEKLSNGEMGIKGINNKEYAIPTYNEIIKKIRENKEIFKTKTEQGFTEMEIVPFGLSLEKLIETAKKTILKHHKEGKLFYTRKNSEDENEQLIPVELDENKPLWIWDGYQNADIDGKLFYFPKEFSQNHQGKTKEQILKETNQGFQVILREKNINIPREGKREIIGNRPQIDTGGTSIKKYIKKGKLIPSPEEYLKAIQTEPIYKNETGQTPEDWFATFLTYLEKHNQVIDDYQGNGSIAYNLGGYFPADGYIPYAYWSRDFRQAFLGRINPKHRNGSYGVRGRVRIL